MDETQLRMLVATLYAATVPLTYDRGAGKPRGEFHPGTVEKLSDWVVKGGQWPLKGGTNGSS